MIREIIGFLSIMFAGIGVIIAAFTIWQTSLLLTFVYLGICAIAGFAVLFFYCAKCPCNTHCAHVIPGVIARFFKREPGPYKVTELVIVFLAIGSIFIIPQYWLLQVLELFILYWVINGIALILILIFVCRGCDNINCPIGNIIYSKAG